jgi:hypothetical protein
VGVSILGSGRQIVNQWTFWFAVTTPFNRWLRPPIPQTQQHVVSYTAEKESG